MSQEAPDGRLWDLFIDSLQALAAPADVQRARFPAFVCKADELALEFDHWYRVARGLSRLTPEQALKLDAIDKKLDGISGQSNAALWQEEALSTNPIWAEVRTLAADALVALGQSTRSPGPVPGAYVPRG